MRRNAGGLALLAVLFSAALTLLVPGRAAAAPVDTGHRPSCSLLPVVHDDSGWVFENHNHERRFLTATAGDGTVLFNDWLYPINQPAAAGQLQRTPLLVGVTHVMWAGDSYDVDEYALPDVHYCANEAAPPQTTLAPPPTTVPVAPPVTKPPAPPVTVPPPTTVPPTTAPPTTEPPISCLDGRCDTLSPAGPECSSDTVGDTVCGVAVSRAAPLPTTGRDHQAPIVLGGGLLAVGAALLPWQRRRADAAQ